MQVYELDFFPLSNSYLLTSVVNAVASRKCGSSSIPGISTGDGLWSLGQKGTFSAVSSGFCLVETKEMSKICVRKEVL